MKRFEIKAAGYEGRWIDVTRYLRTASGMEIKITHNVPKKAGVEYRWVQTIIENGSFFQSCRRRAYVDPFGPTGAKDAAGREICKADDGKPFYWTDAEFKGGQGPFFYDKPSEPAPAAGRSWIHFFTSLAEVTGKDVQVLVTVHWGFDRLADGTVKEAGVRLASDGDQTAHLETIKRMYPKYNFSIAPTAVAPFSSSSSKRPMDMSCTRR
ncbi:MAG: hypothetical protein HY717_00085 [Planctomycetes bacterium]|nr:hypothetical protein [Planctomycetota bacterium]